MTAPSDIGPGRNLATWLRVAPLLNTTAAVFDAAGLYDRTLDNSLVATLFLPSETAWAQFMAVARLTREQLLANTLLVAKLARNCWVPHVRAPSASWCAMRFDGCRRAC